MRQDYGEFVKRNTTIIALGPDGPNSFKRYWTENELPFIGCADIKSKVAAGYQQEVNWFKMGRMPALLVIDKNGLIRFSQYGESMQDIPTNEEVLKILDQINQEA